jgi:hypothetical protein
MKILNREEFGKEPEGILFFQYEESENDLDDIRIKHKSLVSERRNGFFDYTYSELIRFNIEQVRLELDDISRDGCFMNDAIYFVLENDDIDILIEQLQRAKTR